MKNKFNRLTSKEWLPFQKSWFKYSNREELYKENIRFFCAAEAQDNLVYYYGPEKDSFEKICISNDIKCSLLTNRTDKNIQFVLIDLLDEFTIFTELKDYLILKEKIIAFLLEIYDLVEDRRFISVIIPNILNKNLYMPYAWDFAVAIGQIFSLKDEKIGCLNEANNIHEEPLQFKRTKDVFYSLYYRKDENSKGVYENKQNNFFINNSQLIANKPFFSKIPAWFILKPQRRKKDEILHPAKYPEDLVEIFINTFTQENENVFDPMSGTGSSQVGALKLNRNGYGTELSPFFADIAKNRCEEFINPQQQALFYEEKHQKFKILNKDARLVEKQDFPIIHYMITSPPYWDMLNMKGAENQAKRVEKGLKTNYSDDTDDIGNIESYTEFLVTLKEVYFNIASIMPPGSYMTIVVKNIKKKGSNYPFAWDLCNLLQEKLILLPEVFWCQDDISIAPFGYGNTWVSNTFHQYCLNFQIPLEK